MSQVRALRELQDRDFETAFEAYQIPDYVLELVPEESRATITGAVYELIDGELGEVWLTDGGAPYHLATVYFTPDFWAEDPNDAEVP